VTVGADTACRDAAMQRCRDAEMQRCRDAEAGGIDGDKKDMIL
jgi:hypothetical protein